MDTATDSRYRETSERLALLLIAQPREGWEEEFEELIRREVEWLALPMTDGENHRDLLTRLSTALAMTEAAYLEARRRRDL
jgi:hypothetical protein